MKGSVNCVNEGSVAYEGGVSVAGKQSVLGSERGVRVNH